MNKQDAQRIIQTVQPGMQPQAFVEICWTITVLDRAAVTDDQRQEVLDVIAEILARLSGQPKEQNTESS